MNASINDWQRLRNTLVLLLVLSFCLFLPTLFHDAFADDEIYLAYANRFLRESNWTELYQLLLKPANPWEFLPLRDFSYWLDFRVYGDDLSGFHATNLLWYGASGAAVFWLFRELILLCGTVSAARATVLSLCGTLIFLVHPAHVEVVAWIASRKDLIAATFSFLGLALLARALRYRWPAHLLLPAGLLLFLACFGKASAMTGIIVATVLFAIVWKRSPEVSQPRKLAYLFLFWGLFAVAFLVHLNVGETRGIRIENHPGLWVMFDRASRILVSQIGILIFPYPLHFYHDVYRLSDWHWLASTSAAFLLMASLWMLSLRRSLWAIGIVLMFTPLFVYLQLMPFTTWSLASERFVFVSVAGLALLLIDLCSRIDNPRTVGALLLLIVVPSTFAVWSRVGDWENRTGLLDHEYKINPSFHSAIRDRIAFTLLPEKRYPEAAALARGLPRTYAADALLALIATEQAYQQMRDAEGRAVDSGANTSRNDFCGAVAQLRSATRAAYAEIPLEPDVSYNNILRTLDQVIKVRSGEAKHFCPGSDDAVALRLVH